MSAGLPGFGLGGLFFIACALLAPILELARTARGRSSRERWRMVGRQFALAVAMIAVIELTLHAVRAVVILAGIAGARSGAADLLGPLLPAAITAILLATLLLVAKAFAVALRAHVRRRP
jgi:hypothetical protein